MIPERLICVVELMNLEEIRYFYQTRMYSVEKRRHKA